MTSSNYVLSNSYFLMLLEELIGLSKLTFLNFSDDKIKIDVEKGNIEKYQIFVDCPFGNGFFIIEYLINVIVIEPNFHGDYDRPPDPHEIEINNEIISIFFNIDNVDYPINFYIFKKKKELINKIMDELYF